MAFGYHWEWRGFGQVSAAFAESYAELEPAIAHEEFEDIYLWVPQLQANIKVRLGEEEGLKFKWLRKQQLPFELWEERPQDFYEFPLSREGWLRLADALLGAGIKLQEYPRKPPGMARLLAALDETDCRRTKVVKQREGRTWLGQSGRVLVGWTRIRAPRTVSTVGLEIEVLDDDEGQVLADLRRAIASLGLDREELRIMNYLQALEAWGQAAAG